jgi:hypothetical protein
MAISQLLAGPAKAAHCSAMKPVIRKRFECAGWFLFIISAIFFIASAIISGDWLAGLGALFFLVANLVFLVPVLSGPKE